MKKQVAKVAIIAAEIVAALAALFVVLAVIFYARLSYGPVSFGVLNGGVGLVLERALPDGYEARFDRAILTKRESELYLEIAALVITDADSATVAGADEVALTFGIDDLLSRSVGPREIVATGGSIHIVRARDQRLRVPAARGRGGRSLFPSSDDLVDRRLLRSAFKRLEVNDAEITFYDEASGRSWSSTRAEMSLRRTQAGITGALDGAFDTTAGDARITADAIYREADGVIQLSLNGERFPISDVLTTLFGERAHLFDAPVSGVANIELSREGAVRSSTIRAALGEGRFVFRGADAPIRQFEWASSFDAAEERFFIERLTYDIGPQSGEVSGSFALAFGEDVRDIETISFDLSAEDMVLAAPGSLPEPVTIDRAALAGAYEIKARNVTLESLSLETLGVTAAGDFSFQQSNDGTDGAKQSPAVSANISVDGSITPLQLLSVWPLGVALGARDWVAARMEAALINNIAAVIDLPAGAVSAEGLVPDEAVDVTFDVTDGVAYFVSGMTPLRNASGKGRLRGNSFKITVDKASVGRTQISDGEVDIPTFIPKWRDTYYRFTARGASEEMLAVLNEYPLRLMEKVNLDPQQFKGKVTTRIEITRPNKRDVPSDEYQYNGTANFSDMTVSGFAGEATIEEAKGRVVLKPRSLEVSASGLLADAPIDLGWKKNFFREDGPSSTTFSGLLDASVGDEFGLSLRRNVRGPVAVKGRTRGDFSDLQRIDFSIDFQKAALSAELFGWRKPPGAPADGQVRMRFSDDGFSIDQLTIAGDGVAVDGALAFKDGLLDSIDFPTFRLEGGVDAKVVAARNVTGALDLTITGKHLNAGPTILQFTKTVRPDDGGGTDSDFWGRGINVTGRVDHLQLRKGVTYRDASLDFFHDANTMQRLNFTAINRNEAPLKVTLAHLGDPDGPQRRIDVRSSELGNLLNGIFGFSSMRGGEGSMAVYLDDPDAAGLSGEIEARGMHIVNAPLLARIFSAGSLDGLDNLMQGEGIDLSEAYGSFNLAGDILTLDEFRASGDSVGITAQGDVSFAPDGPIAMSGAVVPVYQLNSALGNAPIIGDILVGRRGEGIVALSYAVRGVRNAPDVIVNPLSALTPGVFRQIFEAEAVPEPATAPDPESDADAPVSPPSASSQSE